MTRKILTVSLTIALVAALIGGATMAWLSAKADLPEATLTAGTVNIEAGQSAIRHLGFTPGQTPVVGPEVIGNYAFIPNANEASVSKVDLAAAPPAEVARYSTVQPRSAAAYGYPVYRVSRLAMDSQGNAWVLNSMTGTGSNVGRQGSVVRISGSPVAGEDTTIPNTSIAGGLAGMLDSDVRVTVFDVGAAGDCPRTINIVEEGSNLYLWIGFYMTEYFEKFAYDPVANTLASTGQSINVAPYNAYTAVIDGNGILWGVSRNASPYPSPSGTPGVFYFDTNNLGAGVTGLGYSNPGGESNPYAILLKSDGTVWVSDGGNWSNSRARYFAVYTWGLPVTVQYVNTGVLSTAMRGFLEDGDGNIWATTVAAQASDSGLVIKLTWDGANWTGATMISGLGELTGLGADAYGWFWVIRYGSNQMSRFDPTLAAPIAVDASVPLGLGPYAYGNFVQLKPPDRPWNPGDCSEVEYWVHNVGTKDIRVRASALKSYWEFNWEWLWDNWDALCFSGIAPRPVEMSGETWEAFVAAVLALEDPVEVTLCEGVEDWVLDDDGYFYYIGREFDPISYCERVYICLRVCLDGDKATNEFQAGTYRLVITFDAIQASHYAPYHGWVTSLYGIPL